MSYISTVLNQLQHLLPMQEFESFVGQHEADKWVKRFKTADQLTILLYAQATGKDSLRDIETGLQVRDNALYHLGITSVARSTLSRANRDRPCEIYESLLELLKNPRETVSRNSQSQKVNPRVVATAREGGFSGVPYL